MGKAGRSESRLTPGSETTLLITRRFELAQVDHHSYIEQKQKLIAANVAGPIRDAAIIQLLILKDGPGDLRKIEAIIEELKRKKDRAKDMPDTLHYWLCSIVQ